MNSDTISQILNLIDKSQNILLLTHAKADCDGLGSLLSAYTTLKDLGKNVTAVTSDPAPENLTFLPSINIVQNSLSSPQDFIITLDVTKAPINKVRYNLEKDNNKLKIIITPKSESYSEKDVSFSQSRNKYDLIIVFDAGSLEYLGEIYDQNSEMFFEVPTINIDHHASNTDFGQINMVDTVAASTTEILYYILEEAERKYNKKLITEDVATLLLAGIITDTGSFQHANTSPKSMESAAKLLDLGARQQEIIKNIYKTKKLSTLKLWGTVLSKVQVDPMYRIVWSSISKEDLEESEALPEESEGIIDDLLTNAPGAEIIMLIKYNAEGYISVSMRSSNNSIDVEKIASEMGGGGHKRAAGYKVKDGKQLDEVIAEILEKTRKYQQKRLNINPAPTTQDKTPVMDKQTSPETPQQTPVMDTKETPVRDRHAYPQEKPEAKTTYLDFTDKKPTEQKNPPNEQKNSEKKPKNPSNGYNRNNKNFRKTLRTTPSGGAKDNYPKEKPVGDRQTYSKTVEDKQTNNQPKTPEPVMDRPTSAQNPQTPVKDKHAYPQKPEEKPPVEAIKVAPINESPKPQSIQTEPATEKSNDMGNRNDVKDANLNPNKEEKQRPPENIPDWLKQK